MPFLMILVYIPQVITFASIEQQPSVKIDLIDFSYKLMTQADQKTPFHSVKQYCITKHHDIEKTKYNINAFKKVFNITDNSISYQEEKCLLNIQKREYVPAINIAFSKFDDFLLFEHYSQDYGIHGFRRY